MSKQSIGLAIILAAAGAACLYWGLFGQGRSPIVERHVDLEKSPSVTVGFSLPRAVEYDAEVEFPNGAGDLRDDLGRLAGRAALAINGNALARTNLPVQNRKGINTLVIFRFQGKPSSRYTLFLSLVSPPASLRPAHSIVRVSLTPSELKVQSLVISFGSISALFSVAVAVSAARRRLVRAREAGGGVASKTGKKKKGRMGHAKNPDR